MEKLKFAEGLGKKIIERQHGFFSTGDGDDLEHIANIKRIIASISEYLKYEGLSEDGINDLADQLRQFARSEYIEMCISNKFEGENDGVVTEDSAIYKYSEKEELVSGYAVVSSYIHFIKSKVGIAT